MIYTLSYSFNSIMAFPPSHSTTFMFHSHEDHHDDPLPSPSLNSSPSFPPPQHFLAQTHTPSLFLKMGSHQFLNEKFLGGAPFMLKRSMSFSGIDNKCEEFNGDEDLSDDGLQFGEKKKRLNMEQVKALEKSFESGNKLEAERKVQLAKALGLQPRQIAIWFQNRRARWKIKQLEKEYEALKKQFEAAKADHDALMAQNQKLHAELQALKSGDYCETISLKKETEGGSWSNGSNSSSDVNLDLSRAPVINGPVSSQNGISLQSTSPKPTGITQFLQHSSRPDHQDEGFCNMFHHIDEQQNFWPWHEQHHFH